LDSNQYFVQDSGVDSLRGPNDTATLNPIQVFKKLDDNMNCHRNTNKPMLKLSNQISFCDGF